MILHNMYLSDDELEQLISEAEADLMPAPPELEARVWDLMQKEFGGTESGMNQREDVNCTECKEKQLITDAKIIKNKNLDFAAYCFRVGMAAAAAVAFVFMLPYLPENHVSPETEREEIFAEQQDWKDVIVQDYPTKEEVLDDAGLLQKVFGAKDIFTESQEKDNLKDNGGL